MRTLVVFILVAALSILASNQKLLQAGRFFNLAQLAASGLMFLVFGAILGPGLLRLLHPEDLTNARPMLALGLGMSGMLLGMGLEPQLLRSLPAKVWGAAALQSGAAGIAVTIPMAGVFLFALHLGPAAALGAAALLGGVASVSSPHMAILWHRSGRLERARGISVALLAMLDDLTGVSAFALALVLASGGSVAIGAGLVAIAILLGGVSGALTAYLIHGTRDRGELVAVLIGSVALISGVAAFLNVSALITGLSAGLTLAVVGGPQVAQAWRTLSRIERPVYLVLLFLMGAHFDPDVWQAWLVAPVFIALRFLGKVVGGRAASRTAAELLPLPPDLGFALLAQGGVALCLLVEFLNLIGSSVAQVTFNVGVIGVLVNEVLAARVFRRALHPAPVVEVGR
ncbi:MAG: cation:proton antiporter [Myxococcaceae bacterium]|nr:cation:proton antiporter [Myxococcaceae bacterium]